MIDRVERVMWDEDAYLELVGDFGVEEYLALQRAVHAVGRVLSDLVPTERLYVSSLGSQQGNRHLHWHLVPLPPGVPYERQQIAALSAYQGYLRTSPEEMAALGEGPTAPPGRAG